MNTPVFNVKEVTPDELLEVYNPEEIMGYCAQCENHDSVWSCPPHRFDPAEFIKEYSFAYVVSGSVSLTGFKDQADAMVNYYAMRRIVNQALLNFEETVPGAVSLYAGHCDACKTCSRTSGEDCIYPDRCRYSLESLGLDVGKLIEEYFGESLHWVDGKIPKQMLVVPALLSPVAVDVLSLIQALEKGTGVE